MEPVLVGIDFSDGSALALRYAVRLAQRLNAPLALLHVVDGNGAGVRHDTPASLAWLDRAGVRATDLVTRPGIPWIEIVRMAGSSGASAITIGSHGAGGFHPVALGSTATRVSVAAPCPVLIVNARATTEAQLLCKPNRGSGRSSQTPVGD